MKKTYAIDIRIYEPTFRSEFPYQVKGNPSKIFGQSSEGEGSMMQPGYFTLAVEMTEEELDGLYEWAGKVGWMKLLGHHTLPKSAKQIWEESDPNLTSVK